MGYASYFEAIQDRISDLTREVIEPSRALLAELAVQAAELNIAAQVGQLELTRQRLEHFRDGLLDLATDPDVQLAYEVFESHLRVDRLADKSKVLEAQIQRLTDQLKAKDVEILNLTAQLKAARQETRKARQIVTAQERFIDAWAQKDPAEMARLLDAYPPTKNNHR